MEEKYVFYLRN